MQLTILGSGTNLHPTRAAAGYFVRTDHHLLLDFGPRTLTNLLKMDIDRHRITHILFSHFHADHFSDFITFFFDALIYTKYGGGSRPPLTVIGPKGSKRILQGIMNTFPGFSRVPFGVTFQEVRDGSFMIGDTKVSPRTMTHVPDLHCVGYRIEFRGKAIAYSGDTMYCDNLVRLCQNVDVAVLDCSFPANKPGQAHLHAGQCGQVARQAGPGRLILSHFYPVAEDYDVRGQAGEEFDGMITKARDRLTIKI
ncbi:putative Ribonuclease Z [Nitrospira sp. KM1]|uniref:MBL fold metallo-hydrolase n=1 Tax=Nitrospira sp. KM1 TaxID=1936990 RepID=UPI0013A7759F|nr:MBL fold metallo-hydrolase [Nitrospira sp. KM1]BCA55671.1 putative Ribonuclease Z [Nitrospira sp. KM1]